MLRQQRQTRILDVIRQRKGCTVGELRNEMGVSQVTIYRDLRELQQEKVVTRVHGGVVLSEQESIEPRFSIRIQTNRAAKESIGCSEAAIVQPGWAIFVDASSTGYLFALALAARNVDRLTLVTNSPQIPLELAGYPQLRVISTGGELQHQLNAYAGPLAISQLASMHFDAGFLSSAGISTAGATTDSPLLAEVLRTVVTNSRQTSLLVDSSKFSRRALVTGLQVKQLDRIVTDANVPEQTAGEFREAGIDLNIAELRGTGA